MKKILFSFLAILLFTACQKQISTDKPSEEIAGAATNKQAKFTVCHYDAITHTSKTIEVTQNALAGHLAHGDLQGDCSAVLTTICNQDWMVKNLDVDHYRNGDPIPQVTDPDEWGSLTTGAWCYYNNNPANNSTYGKLYNWYAVTDQRGLAPVGWRIPTQNEYVALYDCLGGEAVAGGALKSTGTIQSGTGLWEDPNVGATNSSGFSGFPGGLRLTNYDYGGIFIAIGYYGQFWSSTDWDEDPTQAFGAGLFSQIADAARMQGSKQTGWSVRCVRN